MFDCNLNTPLSFQLHNTGHLLNIGIFCENALRLKPRSSIIDAWQGLKCTSGGTAEMLFLLEIDSLTNDFLKCFLARIFKERLDRLKINQLQASFHKQRIFSNQPQCCLTF